MATRTGINVDIIAQYKGKAEVTKAKNDLASIGGEAKKLAGYFGASLGTAAVIAFGKSAVTAFAADDKSAKILGNTLANLNQQFADPRIEQFITQLSELNGIAKTDLRTAFDTLVRASGSATKAQDLLNLSLDVSSGTGKNLSLVSGAIAKAYGGNVVALGRLGAGLSKNDLKTKSFIQLQKELNGLFAGDATTAADSYGGKIARLGTIWEQFKITIGTGVVDALSSVGSSSGLADFQGSMDAIAKDISYVITGMGVIAGEAERAAKSVNDHSFGLGGALAKGVGNSLLIAPIKILYNLGKTKQATVAIADAGSKISDSYHDSISAANQLAVSTAKIAKDQAIAKAKELATAKAIAAAAAAKLKSERDALALKLAGSTADMQNIEIQAALQRGQSAQVNDVLLLQRALINGNAAQAEVLAQAVLKSNGLVMDVAGNISSLKGAKNPFGDWPPASASALSDIAAIQEALAKLVAKPYIVQVVMAYGSQPGTPGGGTQFRPGDGGLPSGVDVPPDVRPGSSSMPSLPSASPNGGTQSRPGDTASSSSAPAVINITVAPGSVVTATQEATANGTQLVVNRLNAIS